jgi:hypothetical protein
MLSLSFDKNRYVNIVSRVAYLLYRKLFPRHRYDILPAGLPNCMACAKNNSWTETVWGSREFPEIYEIGVFQEKKWLGKSQY